MTNEEMLKDIQLMSAESITTINKMMEFLGQYQLPDNTIETILQSTLQAAEENNKVVTSIINDNAYHDAMSSVLPIVK